MIDIVEWLRTYARCCKRDKPGAADGCTVAADEIERLRAALREIAVMHPGSADDSGNVARNALWEGGEGRK